MFFSGRENAPHLYRYKPKKTLADVSFAYPEKRDLYLMYENRHRHSKTLASPSWSIPLDSNILNIQPGECKRCKLTIEI